jgi:vacuolar-type H+-ATPase subunit E/Vma4
VVSDTKLARFIGAVNDEIDGKVAVIIKNAEAEREKIISEAEEEAENAATKLYDTSIKRIQNKFTRETSQQEFSGKKTILRHREELTEKLFAQVEEKLAALRNSPEYIDIIVKKMLVTPIENGAEILLSPDDMKYVDTLKKAVKNEVQFKAEESIEKGGFSVFNKAAGTIIDKTFDSALDEQKQAFINKNFFA